MATTVSSPRYIPKGLNAQQTITLKNSIASLESARYDEIGGSGNLYSGKYQMSPIALQTLGFTSPFAGDRNNVNDPRIWKNTTTGGPLRNGIGSREDFLNNPQVQERAMDELLSIHSNRLRKLGVINDNTPPDQIAGNLAAAHLLGPDGFKRDGLQGTDGFGTPAKKFYDKAVADQNGASTVPTAAAKAAAPPSENQSAAETARLNRTGPSPTTPALAPLTSVTVARSAPVVPVYATGNTPPTIELISSGGSTSKEQLNIELPIKNILEPYTTVNCLFTLSSISADDVNFPDNSYRQNKLGRIIAASGGRQKERVGTAYVTDDNPDGSYDFFIDNVIMEALIAPSVSTKGTNVFSVTFDIHEPYSIGQFLQACEIASLSSGHTTYGQAPYLLTIDFVGGVMDELPVIIKEARRFIPLRIINVDMTVSTSGCKYAVNATVWNEVALLDSANVLKQDVSLIGKTPEQLLQNGFHSLAYHINTRLKEMADPRKGEVTQEFLPDEVAIIFPIYEPKPPVESDKQPGATNNGGSSRTVTSKVSLEEIEGGVNLSFRRQTAASVSPLGRANMLYDINRGSMPNKVEEIKIWDDPTGIIKRNLISIDPKESQFVFRKGTTIVNAITEIMLMSDYCSGLIDKKPDQNGMYDWFRIDTEVYLLKEKLNLNGGTNRVPKLLVFKVVPYKIHSSKISFSNAVPDYKKLVDQTVKRYDYIYTGKNVDIIDFQISLNNAFYTPQAADASGLYSSDTVAAQRNARDATNLDPGYRNTTASNGTAEPVAGVSSMGLQTKVLRNNDGAPNNTFKNRVAKFFQERILNSDLSMVTATLKIVGDPYYLADSGLGNYTNTNSTSKMNLTSTGSMDYQSGEVDILVRFFTPVDISSTGSMVFAKDINKNLNVPFSGLYQVFSVKNSFVEGQFTQELSLLRRPNQQLQEDIASAFPDSPPTPNPPPPPAQTRSATPVQSNPTTQSNFVQGEVQSDGSIKYPTGAISYPLGTRVSPVPIAIEQVKPEPTNTSR